MIFKKIDPLLHFFCEGQGWRGYYRTYSSEEVYDEKVFSFRSPDLWVLYLCLWRRRRRQFVYLASPDDHCAAAGAPGPYTVACSNIAQDFSRVPPDEKAKDYWEGYPSASGASRYMTDLLADPVNALSVSVTAPNDSNLYGSFAGKPIQLL